MRIMHCLSGALVATVFACAQAMATPVLPEGTPIIGSPTSLLGFDAGANDYFAGGVSAVNDQNIEFVTDDFSLFIDFQSDGLLSLLDNLGTGSDVFNDTLQFSFTGLKGTLLGIQLVDASALTAGKLLFNIVDHDTFALSLNNVQFSPGFSHIDLGISIDEPPLWALFGFAMLCAYIARRRSVSVRDASITP